MMKISMGKSLRAEEKLLLWFSDFSVICGRIVWKACLEEHYTTVCRWSVNSNACEEATTIANDIHHLSKL